MPVNTFFEEGGRSAKAAAPSKTSPLPLLTHPDAVRLLRAYSMIDDGPMRLNIVEMVERLAVRSGGLAPRRKRRYAARG